MSVQLFVMLKRFGLKTFLKTFVPYRKEKAEFEKKRMEEMAKWEEFKREEHKKLQRERKLFEKHAATVRARPDKQERDEIQVCWKSIV